MTTRNSKTNDKKGQPDFAKGQRKQPQPVSTKSDYARGERKLPEESAENQRPDYAGGQRDLPKPADKRPDFAEGLEDVTQADEVDGDEETGDPD